MKRIKYYLLTLTFGIILYSCGDPEPPKPKYNAELKMPLFPERIGHTYAQIEFWEKNNPNFHITEKTDTTINFQYNLDKSTYFYYYFKDGRCEMVTLGIKSYSKKKLAVDIQVLDGLAKEFGFEVKKEISLSEQGIISGNYNYSYNIGGTIIALQTDTLSFAQLVAFKIHRDQ